MKNIKYLFVSLSLISLFSCSDFLDRDPKGVMDQDRFFLSPDAGYSAVVKCYKTLKIGRASCRERV